MAFAMVKSIVTRRREGECGRQNTIRWGLPQRSLIQSKTRRKSVE
jgi:hypothetical protein